MTTNFFHPSLLLLFLDPGSEIRDSGWVKIRIRGSSLRTLIHEFLLCFSELPSEEMAHYQRTLATLAGCTVKTSNTNLQINRTKINVLNMNLL
jgi:hypothetical protein